MIRRGGEAPYVLQVINVSKELIYLSIKLEPAELCYTDLTQLRLGLAFAAGKTELYKVDFLILDAYASTSRRSRWVFI